MTSIKKNMNLSSVLLIAVLTAIIAYQVGAERVAPVQPATVAVVNLPAVLEGLAQRGEAQANLQAMSTRFRTEREQREAEITRLRSEYDELRSQEGVTAAQLEEAEATLALESLRYQEWMQFTAEQLDVEQALLLQDLYRAIKREAANMSRAENYDLVVVDDADGELSINPQSRASRAAQVEQQIMSRLMLHVNPTIDITNDLIERMNNAYRASR